MPQDLKQAAETSRYVLDLIGEKTLAEDERRRVIEESVRWPKASAAGVMPIGCCVGTARTDDSLGAVETDFGL